MFDLIIKNGTIIDGSGKDGYKADIGIENGKISRIAVNLHGAEHYLDASGLAVTPGFIDSHSHADKKVLFYPEQTEKLQQGITTSVAGQCGGSAAPVFSSNKELVTRFGNVSSICKTFNNFIKAFDGEYIGSNLVPFIGHGTIRKLVMGDSGDAPSDEQMDQMLRILEEAFECGAAGLSFGLFYAPGCHASTDEAIAFAKAAASYNRPVAAHIRNESDYLVEAVEEFISIVSQSGARGILSHHKAVRKHNWGKVRQTIALLKQAVAEGVDIYCDLYPFCASSTSLSQAFVPNSWRRDGTNALIECIKTPELYDENKSDFVKLNGNNLDWVLINTCPAYPQYEGMTLNEISRIHGKDDFDTAMDIIVACRDQVGACFFTVSEEDLRYVLSWDRTMICTDSGMADSKQRVHPRMIASFPRALCRYVKEQKVLSLTEMIRRMTALPAFVYGLSNKGLIGEGYDADICIFDPDLINNPSDFVNCRHKTEGLNYVLVSGQIVVNDGIFNGNSCGKLLTK